MGASHQISSTTVSSLVVKLWRGAGATCGATRCEGVTRGAGACTCLQSSFLMSYEHYNAKLLLVRKNNGITQNNKNLASKTMKSGKHNGITHINNSLAGRLKQGTLPVQCLTAGAATLPSIHNVFSQALRNH